MCLVTSVGKVLWFTVAGCCIVGRLLSLNINFDFLHCHTQFAQICIINFSYRKFRTIVN